KGSHGRLPSSPERGPVFLSTTANTGAPGTVEMTSVKARMLRAMSLDD
ncbi:MAG: hypothetical protein ACI9D0_001742, partial [Bacteroidia bacterium]